MGRQKSAAALILPLAVLILNLLILLYPYQMIEAAKDGLSLWATQVLPALLPFGIFSNLLIGLGIVSFLGVWLSPLMSLFRLPGSGAFGVVMGLMSGYPMGAKITAGLRQSGELEQSHAEGLLCLSNCSGPLFMLGAVGTGMFGSPTMGYYLLLSHYIGAFGAAVIFSRFLPKPEQPKRTRSLWNTSLRAMYDSRRKDGRPLGGVLADSVKDAVLTMLVVGGFIVVFSIVVRALEITGLLELLTYRVSPVFKGILVGGLELTNGQRVLSQADMSLTIAVSSAALCAFGGLSIHCQCLGFLAQTDIRVSKYFLAKVLHTLCTAVAAWVMYPFFRTKIAQTLEVFAPQVSPWQEGITRLLMSMVILVLLGIVSGLFRNRTKTWTWYRRFR